MQNERDQLHQFDEEVLAHPESAQSFATNGFLNVLASVFDNGEFDLRLFKDALRAFATVLPHFFNTVIKNETETHMWETTSRLSDTVLNSLLNHQNPGIRIHAVKCLQVLATIFSRPDRKIRDDISLNLIRTQHRLLNTQELEAKGEVIVNMLLNKLEDQNEQINVLTAVVNSMIPLVRKRPHFLARVSKSYVQWWKTRPQNMTPIQKKSADKVVKVAFVTLIRADELSQQRNDLINAFGAVNGNTAVFLRQSRGDRERRENNHDESRRAKRQMPGADSAPEKRIKVSGSPPQPAKISTPPKPSQAPIINPFTNFDITTIPLQTVIDLCMAALCNVSVETIKERIDMLPPSGLMGTAPTSGSAASITAAGAPVEAATTAATATPPPPPPPSQPAEDMKLHREAPESKEYRTFKAIDTKGTPGTSRVPLASVKERASEALRMKPFELPAPKPLTPGETADYIKQSVNRILDAESYLVPKTVDQAATTRAMPVWNQSAKTVWLLIVSKLLTRGIIAPGKVKSEDDMDTDQPFREISTDLKEMLVNFIIEDLPGRLELALEWLHEEFETDTLRKRADPNYEPQYFRWLLHLLHRGIPTLDAKDKTLAKLYLDAPALNDDAIDILHKIMKEEAERFVACVSTLRDLVTNRPPVREKCLNVLLEYCINPDVRMRSTSIVAVRRWVPDHTAISARVEEFAVQAFQKLTQEPPAAPPKSEENLEQQNGQHTIKYEEDGNDNEQESKQEQLDKEEEKVQEKEQESGWREMDVVRHSELLFALCAKDNELLDDLFRVYIATTEQVQRIIRQHIYQLIKTIGMQSPKLLETIRHFPPGSETLVIRILVTLCDTGELDKRMPIMEKQCIENKLDLVRPTPELVEAVKSVHKERNLDAKFIVPIVSGLTKEDVKHNLPQIIDLLNSSETQRKIVKKVFSRIVSSGASTSAPMTPPELLLALHELEESVPLPKAVEAINVCFTMPETFEAKHVLLALRHLVDQPKIPLLLMVTMIRTVSVYKELIPFILTLLQTLISKKIWMYPKLWDGFVKCTERTQPDSVKIIASLPKAQLQNILHRIPSIRSPLRDYAEENQFVRVLVEMKEMGLIQEEEDEEQERLQQ